MSKLTELIDRQIDRKLQGLNRVQYVPATVTAVRADYLRADVKLRSGGAELKGMLNKSGEKLKVGQDVKVAYLTLPSAGWIALTGGEADPIKEGGGWVVDTAAVFDADNLHQWVADEELMADINAQTKLYYGSHARIIPIQGYACRFGSSTTLTYADSTYFGTEINMKMQWRSGSGSSFTEDYVHITLAVNSLTALAESGDVVGYRYVYSVRFELPNGVIETYTSAPFDRPDDVFLVPTISSVSGDTSYSSRWGTTDTVETPYGYTQCTNITIMLGVVTGDVLTLSSLRTSSGGTTVWICGRQTGRTYSCVPLEDLAEKYYDLGVTKRSKPREAGTNG